MLHVLGWAILGLMIGAAAWLLRPTPRPMNLLLILLLSVAGALFGGFVSWTFWDFPANVITVNEFITTPALVSDCLAAVGSLAVLSLATGVVIVGNTDNGSDRRRI